MIRDIKLFEGMSLSEIKSDIKKENPDIFDNISDLIPLDNDKENAITLEKISDLIPPEYFRASSKEKTLRFVGYFTKHLGDSKFRFYCFPKYMNKRPKPGISEMSLITRAIELSQLTPVTPDEVEFSPVKINSDEKTMFRSNLAEWIVRDFLQNGIVTEKIKQTDFRNRGYSNWSKTVSRIFPTTDGESFIYPKRYHTYHQSNDEILIGQIHRCVVAEAIEFLHSLGITDIPIPEHNAYILGHLEQYSSFVQNVLNRAYDDKRIHSLRAIYAWCNKFSRFYNQPIGTISFELVWERCLRCVFDNVSDDRIKGDFTFDSPVYHIGGNNLKLNSNGIPDIIYIDENKPTEKKPFMLLDAKYYLGEINGDVISKVPAYHDVSKQLYYYDILCSYGLKPENGVNAFVMPVHNLYGKSEINLKDNEWFRYIGYVDYDDKQSSILCDKFKLIRPEENNKFKATVLLVQIEPKRLYEMALQLNDNEKLDKKMELLSELQKRIDEIAAPK